MKTYAARGLGKKDQRAPAQSEGKFRKGARLSPICVAQALVLNMALTLALTGATTRTTSGQTIFPNLTGDTLLDSLRANYTASQVQPIDDAVDIVFSIIDRANNGSSDGVYGVYTGFFVEFDNVPSSDPSEDVLNYPDHNTLGINIEHTWPQTKGAGASDGNAHSDMHHLFPSKRDVNFARAALPFGSVHDVQATTWYRHGSSMSTIPGSFIDEYSELQASVQFEPREDHKGNLARSLFYFYTIYKQQADAADASYFGLQKDDLRLWHLTDPPDAAEVARNAAVAAYQDGKINPYVQDFTLVDRAFFEPLLSVGVKQFEVVTDADRVRVEWMASAAADVVFFTLELVQENAVSGSTRLDDQKIPLSHSLFGRHSDRSFRHTFNNLLPGTYAIYLRAHKTDGIGVSVGSRRFAIDSGGSGSVYPNPASTSVSIEFEQTGKRVRSLRVYDSLGQVVTPPYITLDRNESVTTVTVDVSSLPNGIYWLSSPFDVARSYRSFVIQR